MPSRIDSNAARAASLLMVLAAVGCHTTTPPNVPKHVPGEVVSSSSAGARIVTIVRPTAGVVRVSLWLDAGSRDASPPQVATLAAWSAQENAGGNIEAVVYPDATELSRSCPAQKLEACVRDLQRALATRAPGVDAVERVRARLRDGRRRALAQDPLRRADSAAMQTLLGESARGFFALGEPDDDAAADGEAIAAFLKAHYGPTRALFVAAGDADPERVREAVADALRHAPAASQARTLLTLEAQSTPAVRVVIDDRDALVVALAAPSTADANALVSALERRLARTPDAGIAMSSFLFPTRGGAIAILRLRARDMEAALACTTRELAALVTEPLPADETESRGDDLESLSRNFAFGTSTHASTRITKPSFGLSVLVRGGRADAARGQDPDAAERTRKQARMQDVLTRALADAAPTWRGEVTQHAASVVTANGARIDVRRVRGDSVAIAVRSALGAAQDPPLLLGRSALLATLTTTACAGMAPEALRAELARFEATLTPEVDADSYGLTLRLPSEHWREGLDLALRCMQSPSLDSVHVTDALARLHARLGPMRSPFGMRALVASLIAPRAPGMFAPWGDPQRLGNENARELLAILPRAKSAARMAVSVVGDVSVHDATLLAARRLVSLPAGSIAAAIEPGALSIQTLAPSTSAGNTTLIVVWHARALPIDALGAQVSAAALQTVLVRAPGIAVTWRDGDAHGGHAWAALALSVAPEALPMLASTLSSAAARIDDALLGDAVAHAREQETRARTEAASRVDVSAERIVRERLTGSKTVRLEAEKTLIGARALLRSLPIYVTVD